MKILSVIIPMYNVANYLEKCINSVYRQNIANEDFEIILVDDGSPDNSKEVAEELVKNYTNTKIISHENKGLGGARNTGISHASGTYILFLDADDYYIDDSVCKLIKLADEYQLDILEFGAQGVDINDNVTYELALSNEPNVLSGVEYYNQLKYMNSACNKLYRLDFLEKNKLNFVEKIYGEDFEFNTRALFFADRTMAIDHIVAKFLQSEGSITRSNDITKKRKYINDLIDILKRINAFKKLKKNMDKEGSVLFFNERMTMVNINIFYQMFKYNLSFKEVKTVKAQLIKEGIYIINHSVSEKKKDFFRKYFLGFNFLVYRIALSVKKIIK